MGASPVQGRAQLGTCSPPFFPVTPLPLLIYEYEPLMPASILKPRVLKTRNPASATQLTAGQMTMVAVGGSIGTGLLLGTAAAIELAGPAVILSFVLAAFISWTVALALGETRQHSSRRRFPLASMETSTLTTGPGFHFPVLATGSRSPSPSEPRWSPPPPTCSSGFQRVPAILWVFVLFPRFLLSINFLARPHLWTRRILVRHDQGSRNRRLHRP